MKLLLLALICACASACAPAASDAQQTGHTGAAAETGIRPGQRAPDLQLTDLDGRSVTSAELLAEGKPFVLYFFATW